MTARRRAVVVITEGAAPDLLDSWSDYLPHLTAMRSGPASGLMHGEFVPYEPSGLFTCFTGRPPAEHGCFSYWAVHSPDHEPVILDANASRHPFLWHRQDLAGVPTGIVNVFGTHPVAPHDGYSIGYPMRRTLHACHPRELPLRLAAQGTHLVHDVNVWFTGGPRAEFVADVLNADRQRAAAALAMFDGALGVATDLTVLNLTSIDRLSHAYWQETTAGSVVPLEEQAVFRAYRLADDVLSEFVDRLDRDDSLFAFSEIGFGALHEYLSLNDVLADAGLLVYGDDGRPDMERSLAYEAVQGSHGVNVNMAGRTKSGQVDPVDYVAVRRRIRAALLAWVNPYTGEPLLADALDREEIHPGPAMDEAPDLVVVPRDWRYLPLGDQFWSARTNRKLQSGWHRDTSYWAGVGSAFAHPTSESASTLDVAPTIYSMLGRAVPEQFTGTSLGATHD